MLGRLKKSGSVTDTVSEERIKEIIGVADAICSGDFNERIKNLPAADGPERELCVKINEMIDRSDAYVRESTACLGYISKNQYFRRIAEHGMLGAYGNAAREINAAADGVETKMERFGEMVGTIASASQQLNASAHSLGDASTLANEQATSVAAAAEEAGANTQTVAAAAEQLNASIQEINRQVSQSAALSAEAQLEAEKANELVNGLANVSQEIESVIELINDVAGQTNLLALNATIEAARAGDAGKGFGVVASEVKNLAGQTARATEEIRGQVSEIQSATSIAVTSIAEIGKKVANFNESSAAIASAIEEQGAATQEIARNVQDASSGVSDVTSGIVGVGHNVEQVNGITGEVSTVANDLAQQAETLREVLAS